MNGSQPSVLYCPSCRDEFQDWVTACPDCGVSTVTALPPLEAEPEPEPVDLVTLELPDLTAAQVEALRWRLEVEGAAAAWVGLRTLELPEEDAAAVEAFVAEIEAEEDDGRPARRPDTLGDHLLGAALRRGSFTGRLLAWWKTR